MFGSARVGPGRATDTRANTDAKQRANETRGGEAESVDERKLVRREWRGHTRYANTWVSVGLARPRSEFPLSRDAFGLEEPDTAPNPACVAVWQAGVR